MPLVRAETPVSTPEAMLLAEPDRRSCSAWSPESICCADTKSEPCTQSCTRCSPSLARSTMSPPWSATEGAMVNANATASPMEPTSVAAAARALGRRALVRNNLATGDRTVHRRRAISTGKIATQAYFTTTPNRTAPSATAPQRRLHREVQTRPSPITASREVGRATGAGGAVGPVGRRSTCALTSEPLADVVVLRKSFTSAGTPARATHEPSHER